MPALLTVPPAPSPAILPLGPRAASDPGARTAAAMSRRRFAIVARLLASACGSAFWRVRSARSTPDVGDLAADLGLLRPVGGALYADQIAALDLRRTRLAVLAACDTGTDPVRGRRFQ